MLQYVSEPQQMHTTARWAPRVLIRYHLRSGPLSLMVNSLDGKLKYWPFPPFPRPPIVPRFKLKSFPVLSWLCNLGGANSCPYTTFTLLPPASTRF